MRALLELHRLLQYAGYRVWDVHRKNGTVRLPSEWVVVENAHPALIAEDEARAIAAARRRNAPKRFDRGYHRSRTSPYLLSGGLFRYGRCESNMTGFRTSSGQYYVCGSQPYRKGMGCGPGVYVPQEEIETEVVKGLEDLVGVCTDPQGFTRQVNEELRRIRQEPTGHDPYAARKIEATNNNITDIRQAIEDGLSDAQWANGRLAQLMAERRELVESAAAAGEPPQIDATTAMSYRRQTDKVLAHGEPEERKQIVRTWVEKITLEPEQLEVEIRYRVPDFAVNGVAAGECFRENLPVEP